MSDFQIGIIIGIVGLVAVLVVYNLLDWWLDDQNDKKYSELKNRILRDRDFLLALNNKLVDEVQKQVGEHVKSVLKKK